MLTGKFRFFIWLALVVILVAGGLIFSHFYNISKKPGVNAESTQYPEINPLALPKEDKKDSKKPTPLKNSIAQEKTKTISWDDEVYIYWIDQALALAEEKQYTDALHALDKAIDRKPEEQKAGKLAADINCMLGKMSYREKDYERAQELFNEALHYDPENLCGKLGLGLCAYRKDVELEKSKLWLESYLKSGGEEAVAYQTLGEIYYHENNLDQAVYYMNEALQRDPDNPRIISLINRIQKERRVEKNFATDDTRHFVVKYEGYENQSAGYIILVLLEEARIIVGRTLDYYPSMPITAILYTNKQFQDVTHTPAWADAIFDGKIRIPAKGLDKKTEILERIVFHEYTHALIFEYTRGNPVPVWFHEGLAQNSEGRVSKENERIFQVFAQYDVMMPLRSLEGSFLGLNAVQAKIAYAESLAAVKYIKTEYGEYAIRIMLNELAQGKTMEQAIRTVFYISYDEFDKRFLNWLRNKY